MQTILSQMLALYPTQSQSDEKNALTEVIQEVALCGLSRAGFFKDAAFYGGTALRIFYGLDRFSEDLDFSLVAPDADFELKKYFSVLESELHAVGLNFKVEEKVKTAESNIKSAFLKGNTKEHILSVYKDEQNATKINPSEVIKIKFEVDTNPPAFASFENKYRLLPSPYQVKLYDALAIRGQTSRRHLPCVENPCQRQGLIRLYFLSLAKCRGQYAAPESTTCGLWVYRQGF